MISIKGVTMITFDHRMVDRANDTEHDKTFKN